ncbi:MAG: helix-turn-helix transcriptional regulator [Thermoproteota archaeon]|nr:helix-turn-helix transcriptional regulator [Thermoproteota archaeon]
MSSGNDVKKCDIVDVWEVLGRRWSLHILRNLSINGTTRFNQLRRLVPGISSTVLSDRLLELEREGLVTKKIYHEIPIRVEYNLTQRAKELEPILYQLGEWVNKWNLQKTVKELDTDREAEAEAARQQA